MRDHASNQNSRRSLKAAFVAILRDHAPLFDPRLLFFRSIFQGRVYDSPWEADFVAILRDHAPFGDL